MNGKKLVYNEFMPNKVIKKGDLFHWVYEVVSDPKRGYNGYEWKIYHRRWRRYLKMIRPAPESLMTVDPEPFISLYQNSLIPMQLHPRIEAFYDVRHIDGSTAFFTEWSDNGTLADCIENGSLYKGGAEVVAQRLRRISGQIARALQYIKTQIPYHGAVCPGNIMLTDRFNAKLSVASIDLLSGRKLGDDVQLWAHTVISMYLGRVLEEDYCDGVLDRYKELKAQMRVEIPADLEAVVIAALNNKLSYWDPLFRCLHTSFYVDYAGPETLGYRNNKALRLIDCGKINEAYLILQEEASKGAIGGYFTCAEYNLKQLHRYWSKEIEEFGCYCSKYVLYEPTDILLWAEEHDRIRVQNMLDKYDSFPECVEPFIPEIREKLLDKPHRTPTEFNPDDPRLKKSDEKYIIEIEGKTVTFIPQSDEHKMFPIPSKDGIFWDNGVLYLPERGVEEDVDYVIREFSGGRFYFDEDKRFLLVEANNFYLYDLSYYDNGFYAPFLLSTYSKMDDEI